MKDSKYAKINSVIPLYLIFSKVDEYNEVINQNNYLTLVPASESKEIIKRDEGLWSKLRDLIRSVN